MVVTDSRDGDARVADDPAEPDWRVSALRASPERVVFTEQDNTDGWIATDLSVDVER